jgi:hypothetical protein
MTQQKHQDMEEERRVPGFKASAQLGLEVTAWTGDVITLLWWEN